MPTPDGFLNVDLEIGARTRARLAPLVDALQGKVFELFHGRIGSLYRVHYEANACARDANAAIDELAAAIEALDVRARRVWNDATLRDFNIGVELERGVRFIELALDVDATSRIIALGGRIVFTAYQAAAIKKAARA